jgi:hypothetical protein
MTRDPYFDIDCISVSRLGVVKSLRDGTETRKVKKETLEFGSQFHEATLEPDKYKLNYLVKPEYAPNRFKVAAMANAARSNPILMSVLDEPGVKIEFNHFFKEPNYDLECKAKLDVWGRRRIIDLKSTSATNRDAFVATIRPYGYHRQGAFYLDGTGLLAQGDFILIGVSKTYPHKTFTYTLTNEDIALGMQENDELINFYIQMPEKPNFKLLME